MKADGHLARVTRLEQGHSLSGLARELGINKGQLSKVEMGLAGLSPGKMRALADKLGLPMDELAPELATMKANGS